MFHVPLYVEGLRSRPLLVFWLAALLQAVLWLAVPMLFYAAPPEELGRILAIGHEFQTNGDFGPPLAYWLAEIAFRAAGLFGVYALAQICVVATYWCVFALGRSIVGATHAAMAVLLMVGIFVFTVPTPNFGPPILAMALWAAALLFYWRAVAQRRGEYWYALAGAVALLLITSEGALILLGVLILFTAATERGRAVVRSIEAWIARGRRCGHGVLAFRSASTRGASHHRAGGRTAARRRDRRREHRGLAAVAWRARSRPCRPRRAGAAGGRLAADPAGPGARHRAPAAGSLSR